MPDVEQTLRTKPRISADLKAHIVNLASSGKFELDDILDKRYSRSTHYRAKPKLKNGGDVAVLKHGKSPGRPPKLGPDELKWLRQLIKHRPNIQRGELCQMLADYLYIKVAETTVGRFLKKNDITRKKLSTRARRRDPLQRIAYRLTMSQYKPEQLVFADETHTNRRTAWRQYGWAPSDERCVLVYLPPYSLDLNPIELAFGTIKAVIRREEDPRL
ncbi:hypothetical protein V8E36_005185 [Tilletia maclaganii]